jgi:D-3-phosphoglycerate dehydrogenase
MKPGAVLINTTRGSIVDEAALAEAVYSGRLTGVAVDVLQGEEKRELQSSPLLACARVGHNVLITPHIGGATEEAIARTESAVVNVLTRLSEAR